MLLHETAARNKSRKFPFIRGSVFILIGFSLSHLLQLTKCVNFGGGGSSRNSIDNIDNTSNQSSGSGNKSLHSSSEPAQQDAQLMTGTDFADLTEKLLGPDAYGDSDCPPGCGCPQTAKDCPRHYQIQDLKDSAAAQLSTEAMVAVGTALAERHAKSREACKSAQFAANGGFCLGAYETEDTITLPNGKVIGKSDAYAGASQRVCDTLEEMISNEGISSFNDFGAGYGQYGICILPKFPNLEYYAYDGAGDIEEATGGFVKYVDLSLPVQLPITEWVFSLEVGEHVPSKYEGAFLRNLHRHNCKGIILSWAVLGQGGLAHINNHSNEYVNNVMAQLGYTRDNLLENKFRNRNKNFKWFERSIMVFRRDTPTC